MKFETHLARDYIETVYNQKMREISSVCLFIFAILLLWSHTVRVCPAVIFFK